MTTPTHTNELYAIALEILDDAEPDLFGLWYFSNGLRDRLAFIMQKLKDQTSSEHAKIKGEATMTNELIIRKVKDHAVCVVVERRSPGEWDLPTAEFPWVRVELTAVTYYHRDGWEEAPPKPKAKKKGGCRSDQQRACKKIKGV